MSHFDQDDRYFADYFVNYGVIPTDDELPYEASEDSAMGEYVHPMDDMENFNKKQREKNMKIDERKLKAIIAESIRKVLSESEGENVYTMEDWQRDGSLKMHPGQTVDDAVVEELVNCVPPATYGNGIFQVGEPYDHDRNTGRALFLTFEHLESGWKYIGLKPIMR